MTGPFARPGSPRASHAPLALGIDTLLADHREWLSNSRVGLVSHDAAVDRHGSTTAHRLHEAGVRLAALFGPEHGFAGRAGAGEATADEQHPLWQIPIYSLYGATRRPTPAMLAGLDVLVIDFQDLGARPYTYVSTLRLVLEAAAAAQVRVVVADRPVPLPAAFDGPLLDPAFESFVGLVGTSMQYGMTPGETARWIATWLDLTVDLQVAPLRGYHRDPLPAPGWPAWVPPSPRIRSWECGQLFTCTVAGEALPAFDYGSGTALSFQVLAADGAPHEAIAERLAQAAPPGVELVACTYESRTGRYAGRTLRGSRFSITDASAFRPVTTCVHILATLRDLLGNDTLWQTPGTRPDFFDKLFGTDTVRLALQDGLPAAAICEGWQAGAGRFAASRRQALLYPHEAT